MRLRDGEYTVSRWVVVGAERARNMNMRSERLESERRMDSRTDAEESAVGDCKRCRKRGNDRNDLRVSWAGDVWQGCDEADCQLGLSRLVHGLSLASIVRLP